MALIDFLKFLLIISWTLYIRLCVLMALGPGACILHLAAGVESPSTEPKSFQTLKTKDSKLSGSELSQYYYAVFFKATITMGLSIC